MKNGASRKDFFREIKVSQGRFLSILFIVALGVAFFSGIRVAEPDMKYSLDEYYDQRNYKDGSVIGTLGLTNRDVEALESLEEIDVAEGIFVEDVLVKNGDGEEVLKLYSITHTLNKLVLEEGRLPKTETECFIDQAYAAERQLQVGDWITLSDSNNEIEDVLHSRKFEIVGIGSSPEYISYERGTTNKGSGEVAGFGYLSEKAFAREAYSAIYYQAKDSKSMITLTNEYEAYMDEVIEKLKSVQEVENANRLKEVQDTAFDELENQRETLEDGIATYEQEKSKVEAELEAAKIELEDGEAKLKEGEDALIASERAWNNGQAQLSEQKKQLEQSAIDLQIGLDALAAGKLAYEEQKEIFQPIYQEGIKEIEAGEALLGETRAALDLEWANLVAQEEEGVLDNEVLAIWRAKLESAEVSYEEEREKLSIERGKLEAGKQEIDVAGQVLEEQELSLKSGEEQIASGQLQVNAAEEELRKGRQEIEAGKEELKKQQEIFEASQLDYEEGKNEAELELAKAKKELDDGQKEIQEGENEIYKLEPPEWYLMTRSDNADYVGYGENANRMRAIGEVFPLLFFLVAALISLTTMTRMVEEQRLQIGTLKALGYSPLMISKKYLGYAFVATILGSVLGVLVGEKLLPTVVIFAYQMMYETVPNIVVPYEWTYASMATIAALICTTGATWISCNKELRATPAKLMRPPTSKLGKRIALERLKFIWKPMSFTWKATMRNLFRYKKRFLMTVFGISSCMALMLVGFGIEDSIVQIGDLQYKELQTYDASIYLNPELEQSEYDEILDQIDTEKGVSEYLEVYLTNAPIMANEKEQNLYLLVPRDMEKIEHFVHFRNRITGTSHELNGDGVILSEKIAKMLELEAGDKMELSLDDEKAVEVTILAITENYFSNYVYMTPDLFRSLYGKVPDYNHILLQGVEQEDTIREAGTNLLQYDDVLHVSYTSDIRSTIDSMLESLNVVILVLVISAGMLAFVVLYNLNNVNITERKRELATIKVLGFFDDEVASYVFRENIVLTSIGCLVGILLGNLLHRYVIVTVEIDAYMFGRNIEFSSYIYSIILTVVFAAIINWIMYFKLKKLDMLESLKSVE